MKKKKVAKKPEKKNIMIERCVERMEEYLPPRWRDVALECLGFCFLFLYLIVGYYMLLASINIFDWMWTNAVGAWQCVITLVQNWVCKC